MTVELYEFIIQIAYLISVVFYGWEVEDTMIIKMKRTRLLSAFIVQAMMMTLLPANYTYASNTIIVPNSDISMRVIDENELEVIDGDTVSKIALEEVDSNVTRIFVSESGVPDKVLIANSETGTVTTEEGRTIIPADVGINKQINIKQSAASYKSKTITKKYSYATIKNALGGTATVASVAGMIIALLVAAGFSVPGMLPVLCTFLGGITGLISYVMKGSSKHGVSVKLKSYMRTLHHGGKTYKVEAWKIVGVSKY